MIRFTDNVEKTESAEQFSLPDCNEIKPIQRTDDDGVHRFWEDVFREEEASDGLVLTDIENPAEIYDWEESDFQFSFDASDQSIQEQLERFDDWDDLDESQKLEAVEGFLTVLGEKLGLEEQPEIVLYEAEKRDCGAYNNATNKIELNRNIMDDSKEVIDTVAHEARHAYQYQRAGIGETSMDRLYAFNILNYEEPRFLDNYCVNFNDYYNQLIEAEARAFAKLFHD